MAITVTVLGCGDLFGSGGRRQAAFLLQGPGLGLLLDCGATVMTGLGAAGLDPRAIDVALISHLHGDHVGGLPFLYMAYQFPARRSVPLTVAGPPGLEAKAEGLFRLMFTETVELMERRFTVGYRVLPEGGPTALGPARVTAVRTVHQQREIGYAYRIEVGDRIVAYSADGEWTDGLEAIADGADLFLCECYRYDRRFRTHLSYPELAERRERIRAKRTLLVHLFADTLARAGSLGFEVAEDGMVLTV